MTASTLPWFYRCVVCGNTIPPNQLAWQCTSCGGELAIEGLPETLDQPAMNGRRLWRSARVLPVSAPDRGTILGEGGTPLVPVEIDGFPVQLKLDSLLPTGSFKDRGAAVLARYLQVVGARRIIVDSSGNAAASMAAFAAAIGLDCTVYVPASASPGKLVQARAYGARVIPVEGSRDEVAQAAQSAAEADDAASYASHNWHPVFVEGVKTWAHEVHQQLGGRQPDFAIVPTGGGSSFVGAWRGFSEVGATLPRLIAAQPLACCPVVRAWKSREPITTMPAGDTLAEGTKIALPSRPRQILRALEESDGDGVAVSETELIEASKMLWALGIYVEPTAALGVAAFRTLRQREAIAETATVVIHITGTGLKSTPVIDHLLS
jgi:threonine synthase